ncbi:MAG TPA: flagellar basal body L-ring protein FlgH [Terriglobales bacterium]|jgi:flagellar L-ring protein precursor FlgH|nr:flagellar basal body L-ring protein FlgH [Terriglobales bacterium]
MLRNLWLAGMLILLPVAPFALGKTKKIQREDLAAYIERMQPQVPELPSGSPGSLWTDNGRLAFLTGDFKAGRVGDLITIVVVHDTTANNANSVSTARTLAASSGITALPGQLKTTGVAQLFSPNSSQALTGKSQASTTSSLQTTLSGRVVAVLSSGLLVIEAERQLTMNNENQIVLVRGLVRRADIGPDNTVASNTIGDLELELKGKGVLSDGTRPPNIVVRTLLRILGF